MIPALFWSIICESTKQLLVNTTSQTVYGSLVLPVPGLLRTIVSLPEPAENPAELPRCRRRWWYVRGCQLSLHSGRELSSPGRSYAQLQHCTCPQINLRPQPRVQNATMYLGGLGADRVPRSSKPKCTLLCLLSSLSNCWLQSNELFFPLFLL